MKKLTIYLVAFLVANIISSCDREEPLPPVTDPQQAILGKWEITHLGNGNQLFPIKNPIAYEEYQTDSVLLTYNYEEEYIFYGKYWIVDTLLFKESTYYINEAPGYADTLIVTEQYRFYFINYNMLRLDLLNLIAINNTSVYKRLN
ncbi:MAG: hypothetical protein RBT74_10315 [Tenuifilaceae bacterium]|jgi:hypothetical protein|nr:hypothetical protein [Tenuifilaceae bacterium]